MEETAVATVTVTVAVKSAHTFICSIFNPVYILYVYSIYNINVFFFPFSY